MRKIFFILVFLIIIILSFVVIHLYSSKSESTSVETIDLEEFLLKYQNPDGGFGLVPLEMSTSIYTTYYIVKLNQNFRRESVDIERKLKDYTVNKKFNVKSFLELRDLYFLTDILEISLDKQLVENVEELFSDEGLVELEAELDLTSSLYATIYARNILEKQNKDVPDIKTEYLLEIAENSDGEEKPLTFLELISKLLPEEEREAFLQVHNKSLENFMVDDYQDNDISTILNILSGIRMDFDYSEKIDIEKLVEPFKLDNKPGYFLLDENVIDIKFTFEILSLLESEELVNSFSNYIQKHKNFEGFYVPLNPSNSNLELSYLSNHILDYDNKRLTNFLNDNKQEDSYQYNLIQSNSSSLPNLSDTEQLLIKLNVKSIDSKELKLLHKNLIIELREGTTSTFYEYIKLNDYTLDSDILEKLENLDMDNLTFLDSILVETLRNGNFSEGNERVKSYFKYLESRSLKEVENPIIVVIYKIDIILDLFDREL